MRQNEGRTTKHHHTPSTKAGQLSRYSCNQIPRGRYQRKNWARAPHGTNRGATSRVSGYPGDGIPALCHVLVRSILSELIGAAKESADVNRERASSGPVKVVVTNQPHSRRHNGVDLVSGVSALLAWFPACWASKIAPCFIGEEEGAIQAPQEVSFACPG